MATEEPPKSSVTPAESVQQGSTISQGSTSSRDIPWGKITIAVLLLCVGIALFSGLSEKSSLIGRLSDPAFARGLITFIITVSTIGLAFIMVYQAFSSGESDKADAEVADNKYRRAREIFAGLMGVLGTIVGFYFGSAEKATSPLSIAEIQIIDKTVITSVTGGNEPYRYTINPSKDGKPMPSDEQIAKDGWIQYSYSEAIKSGTVTIVVTDAKNTTATKTKEVK